MLARSPLFEKFSLQRNFQGLLSIVQLSRFLSFFSCDSFDILSNPFRFVKNFFIFLFRFFCFAHPLSFQSASSDSLYRLSHLQGVVNSFFHLFFQRFRLLLTRSPAPGCSASASPAGMVSCGFSRPRHQRQVLSYHQEMELSMFVLFFIYFRQFTQF